VSRVPSKDYGRQYDALLPELLPEIERVLRTEDPILGPSVAAFERECAAYFGTADAVGVNSGTDALILALRALGVGPGDDVVVSAHTFLATITAIVTVGARPVLVDPDPRTINVDAARLEAALTPRTRAVLPVHMYGALCPMPAIAALCTAKRLLLVEDAAQAHGAGEPDGPRAGAFGDAGCFSFHPSKNLGAFGDGGLVTARAQAFADRLRVLRNHGKVSKYAMRELAGNSRLDTLQAAILRLKLRRLDADNARRRRLAQLYRERLGGARDLTLPHDPGDARHVFHLYVVRTARRDALREHLERHGVHAGMHYPIPPHLQQLDRDLGYRRGQLPVTEQIAATCLSLPISPELGEAEIERCCDAVRSFHG
jgi:dTDP-4-amino-4,6-dideoxygalactose transaminase